MAEHSKIEWTDATWNPLRARSIATGKVGWHCEHASPGCVNCYAEKRINVAFGTNLPFRPGHRKDVELFLDEKILMQPLRRRKPTMYFPCSTTDLFGEWVSDGEIDRIFAVMALSGSMPPGRASPSGPRLRASGVRGAGSDASRPADRRSPSPLGGHTFQVLTKRSARMHAYMGDPDTSRRVWAQVDDLIDAWDIGELRAALATIDGDPLLACLFAHGAAWGGQQPWPLRNVWLGVSVEDQQRANERIPNLLATPAAIRFVSAEPLLGPVNISRWLRPRSWPNADGYGGDHAPGWTTDFSGLDWVIVGGESGRDARPMHPDWARSLRDQCVAAGQEARSGEAATGKQGIPFFFKQWGEWAPAETAHGARILLNDGTLVAPNTFSITESGPGGEWEGLRPEIVARVGKKAAGALLDGREWREMPGADRG